MNVCVIGAGPAGLMAALAASQNGHQVSLYEKNPSVGKKLSMTGNGRCNITNSAAIEDFLTHVHSNPRFLYSAFHTFFNQDIIQLMKSQNVECKEEDNGRIFPVSNRSQDVIGALKTCLHHNGVSIYTNKTIQGLWIEESICKGIDLGNKKEAFDHIILTTGGCSYPMTGSDGTAYQWLKDCGHTIISPREALVPIRCKVSSQLAGLTLQNIELSLQSGQFRGDLLFTHTGISGPVVINSSDSYKEKETISLDLFPTTSKEQLDQELLNRFNTNPNKTILNALLGIVPKRLLPIIIEVNKIPTDTPVHQITKEQRLSLVQTLKDYKIETIGTEGWNQAMVTAGGVDVKNINPKNMTSKIIQNLSLAGEIIDVHADTGGYNLQIAWSTGFLAGHSIKKKTDD